MRALPPAELATLLERLGLATAAELRSVAAKVERRAPGLAQFPCVWIDTLTAVGKLTAYQQQELHANRGHRLRLGDYVLARRLATLGYADHFLARDVTSGRLAQLLVAPAGEDGPSKLAALSELVETSLRTSLSTSGIVPLIAAGQEADRVFIVSQPVAGQSLAQVLTQEGRLPPEMAGEITRQICVALAALEQCERRVHGDLCPSTIWLDRRGNVQLLFAGVRQILRPHEGYGWADGLPEMFDYLAPERVGVASPPNVASELAAVGLLCWRLLAGRTPYGGGSALGKLRAAHAARVADVRRYSPYCPAPLSEAIRTFVLRDPASRPSTLQAALGILSKCTDRGPRLLELVAMPRELGRQRSALNLVESTVLGARKKLAQTLGRGFRLLELRPAPLAVAAALAGILLAAFAAWAPWRPSDKQIASSTTNAQTPLRSTAASVAAPPVSRASTDVLQATFIQDLDPPNGLGRGGQPAQVNSPQVLLAGPSPVLDCAALRSGQVVRGAYGNRALLNVKQPLVVIAEGVRFENIDFVAAQLPAMSPMIEVRCRSIEFVNCTFSSAGGNSNPSIPAQVATAIRWCGEAGRPVTPASGRLRVSHSVFHDVIAIEKAASGPLVVEATNTLWQGRGAVLHLEAAPRLDETIAMRLDHATLRGAVALCEIAHVRSDGEPGPLQITAIDCVLASEASAAFVLHADHSPAKLLTAIEWLGQGSVLSAGARMALWHDPGGTQRPMSDDDMNIAGLVRGHVQFSGELSRRVIDSTAMRWEAPRRSDDAPGVSASLPNLPVLETAMRGTSRLQSRR